MAKKTMANNLEPFDLAIHLVGEQALPNLIGIKALPAKQHLLLTSSRTDKAFDKLQRCLPDSQILRKIRLNDPFDLVAISNVVQREITAVGGRVAVNLTGGTKMMSIGAMNGAKQSSPSVRFYYFETQSNRCLHWEDPLQSMERARIPKLLSIDDFINLSEFTVQQAGVDMEEVKEREEISLRIWSRHRDFQEIQTRAQKELDKKNINARSPFSVQGDIAVEFDGKQVTSFSIGGVTVSDPARLITLDYLAGRWFEEYVYWEFKPFESAGIFELRLGMKVMFDKKPNSPAQEFDLLVSDGRRLWIIECKAGQVKTENLAKLENITEKFAGIQGVGILVSRWSQFKNLSVIEQTQKSRRYVLVHGDRLSDILPKQIQSVKPGTIWPRFNDSY